MATAEAIGALSPPPKAQSPTTGFETVCWSELPHIAIPPNIALLLTLRHGTQCASRQLTTADTAPAERVPQHVLEHAPPSDAHDSRARTRSRHAAADPPP